MTKSFLVLILSVSVLSACNQNGNDENVDVNTEVQSSVEKEVEIHDAVNLPTSIFVDSDYNIEGQPFTFSRSITGVEMREFDDSSEIDFQERYGEKIFSLNYDLKKDFKLLVVDMKHEVSEGARSHPLEAFMFNEGSGLVIGDLEIGEENTLVQYQQEYLSTDFKVGKTLEETGNALIAIPKEYTDDPKLQLRLTQKTDDENKYIYINLN